VALDAVVALGVCNIAADAVAVRHHPLNQQHKDDDEAEDEEN
jgi:hypothetical protein